jgi:hypothetical protein
MPDGPRLLNRAGFAGGRFARVLRGDPGHASRAWQAAAASAGGMVPSGAKRRRLWNRSARSRVANPTASGDHLGFVEAVEGFREGISVAGAGAVHKSDEKYLSATEACHALRGRTGSTLASKPAGLQAEAIQGAARLARRPAPVAPMTRSPARATSTRPAGRRLFRRHGRRQATGRASAAWVRPASAGTRDGAHGLSGCGRRP